MYQISQIRNNYNLEENCVVTEIFALNLSNKDDNGEPTPNREVAIYKKFCMVVRIELLISTPTCRDFSPLYLVSASMFSIS